MSITKHQYILKSLRKIAHKEWESFIVSRIIHGLDDDDIEFVTQQLVRFPNGKRALTDLYFPQFEIHVEVDEPHHEKEDSVKDDERREQDIIQTTDHKIMRVKIADESEQLRSLSEIRNDVDNLIKDIATLKQNSVRNGDFIPWDLDLRYSSDPVIKRGYLSIDDNVVFKTQVEALRCFGFQGKGYQRGGWIIPDGSHDEVWFPRLYQHGMWHNELADQGREIIERASSDDPALKAEAVSSIAKQRERGSQHPDKKYIVFAKARDALGFNLLRYVGSFKMNLEDIIADELRFERVSTKEDVRKSSESR